MLRRRKKERQAQSRWILLRGDWETGRGDCSKKDIPGVWGTSGQGIGEGLKNIIIITIATACAQCEKIMMLQHLKSTASLLDSWRPSARAIPYFPYFFSFSSLPSLCARRALQHEALGWWDDPVSTLSSAFLMRAPLPGFLRHAVAVGGLCETRFYRYSDTPHESCRWA